VKRNRIRKIQISRQKLKFKYFTDNFSHRYPKRNKISKKRKNKNSDKIPEQVVVIRDRHVTNRMFFFNLSSQVKRFRRVIAAGRERNHHDVSLSISFHPGGHFSIIFKEKRYEEKVYLPGLFLNSETRQI
jgi:hypothetical protein